MLNDVLCGISGRKPAVRACKNCNPIFLGFCLFGMWQRNGAGIVASQEAVKIAGTGNIHTTSVTTRSYAADEQFSESATHDPTILRIWATIAGGLNPILVIAQHPATSPGRPLLR